MHKTIGIVGGMTPESTTIYYETITRRYSQATGDYGYPRIVINSMSFQQFVDWMNDDAWDTIADALTAAVGQLASAGADVALMATNTMHMVFERVQTRAGIPMISIIDATARAVKEHHLNTVGLLGTRFTMQKPFYRDGLLRSGIQTIVPDASAQEKVHDIIFTELGRGLITEDSKQVYLGIISDLEEQGAEGIILGCTEIPLLIQAEDCRLPLFDTAELHAVAALQAALS